ncbi:MAG: hypothetical protein R6V77_05010, partial [Candidatus Cloacimonadaceae bacterium]
KGWEIFAAVAGGARNMVSVALATAAAGIIVGVVALGLGQLITAIIDTLSGMTESFTIWMSCAVNSLWIESQNQVQYLTLANWTG